MDKHEEIIRALPRITVEQCPCGYLKCSDYHLVGIGKFAQGSGFSKEEAEMIASLINAKQQDYYTYDVMERQL